MTQRLAAARVAKKRVLAVKVAKSKVGARYRAGMSGPSRFDCSGLAMYVAKHAYGRSLPHYSKGSAASNSCCGGKSSGL